MTLNNGMGDIISNKKNIPLYGLGTEKLMAIKVCNFYWLITHQRNNADFYVFKITENGISAPIIQNIGTPVGSGWNGVGALKFSPDGSTIACPFGPDANMQGGGIDVFDFDLNTGLLSNFRTISNIDEVYGVEFSPSGQYLYASRHFSTPSNIFQFDLFAGDIIAIENSIMDIHNEYDWSFQRTTDIIDESDWQDTGRGYFYYEPESLLKKSISLYKSNSM